MSPLILLKSAGASMAEASIRSWPQYPALTFMTAAALISVVTTVVALKIFKRYNLTPEICRKIKVIEYQKNHPLTPLLGLVVCVAAAIIFLPLGVLTVIPLGMYAGLLIEKRISLRSQRIHAIGNPRVKPFNKIAQR